MDEAEEDVDRCRDTTTYMLADSMIGAELMTCSQNNEGLISRGSVAVCCSDHGMVILPARSFRGLNKKMVCPSLKFVWRRSPLSETIGAGTSPDVRGSYQVRIPCVRRKIAKTG
jgi:hypothetical protein